jgi:hypothetical protein
MVSSTSAASSASALGTPVRSLIRPMTKGALALEPMPSL